MTRRDFVAAIAQASLAAQNTRKQAFQTRGYYYTFSRMPTLGLAEWKQIADGVASDGGNLILLWIGGGFRSKKFPITWAYNADHRNIQRDFVREWIDYAHTRGIQVLLGFTPFSYDGVNQYPLQFPELKALQRNGNFAQLAGIHCWGYALNPAEARAQQFMFDYAREMYFDFYPNADGLLIESSDYAICEGGGCAGRYYELEYSFVRAISQEVWAKKPSATIVVYPHYFTGAAVPGFQTAGAKYEFDKRYTLFFTPHSAYIDPALISQARNAIYWDSCTALGLPADTKSAAQKAASAKIPGFVTSNEAFSYVMNHVEWGEARLLNKRLKPFGFDWITGNTNPYEDPIVRVNRIAFRVFSQNPTASMNEFESQVSRELACDAAPELLTVHRCCYEQRSWASASPAYRPEIFREALEYGRLSRPDLEKMSASLKSLPEAVRRLSSANGTSARHFAAVGNSILKAWDPASRALLERHITGRG